MLVLCYVIILCLHLWYICCWFFVVCVWFACLCVHIIKKLPKWHLQKYIMNRDYKRIPVRSTSIILFIFMCLIRYVYLYYLFYLCQKNIFSCMSLFVCLFVCKVTQICGWVLMKLSRKVDNGMRNNWLNFDGDPVHNNNVTVLCLHLSWLLLFFVLYVVYRWMFTY